MATISLGQMTALDVCPADFITIASAAGCDAVSLMVNSPSPQTPFPVVNADNYEKVRSLLDRHKLDVLNVECFMLTPQTDIEQFRPGMELGAKLDARGATVLLYDHDESRVVRNLRELCSMATDFGLRINLEFMPLAPRWHTIGETAQLIDQVGENDLGIGVDLLHLFRSGGNPEDLASTPAELIHYVQICDSNDASAHNNYGEEAGGNRLTPGAGKLPIADCLRVLPAFVPIEIEVPQRSDIPAEERVSKIVKATRRLLNKLT